MRNLSPENVTEALTRVFDDTPDPRLKEIMCALVRYLHNFAREVKLTPEEWSFAMDALLRAGKVSDARRNEFIMFSDVLGLSAVVDMMNGGGGKGETAFSQLGPFFEHGLPLAPSHVVDLRSTPGGDLPGDPVLFTGTVVSSDGTPLAGALVDAWQTDVEGLYDLQRLELQGAHRLRCRLRTNGAGQFVLKTIRPLGYTAPMDGPGGQMLTATRRNIWRPDHFHFRIGADDHRTLVTELFPEGDEHLDNDVAFGVRSSLVLELPECRSAGLAQEWGMPVPFKKVDYLFELARL
jgi:protocatechuate 3,4-dioxygenase beta subunit